jgi:hypothetical protein
MILCVVVSGCAAIGATSTAKATEAMRDCNAHARFGRMVVAAEAVRPTERDAFLDRRKGWGANVQIADSEMLGMKLVEKEATCWVRISWYRLEDGELRQTTIRQTWHEKKASEDWELTAENREAGDIGLLGEAVQVLTPSEPRAHAQFPTVRIGGTD